MAEGTLTASPPAIAASPAAVSSPAIALPPTQKDLPCDDNVPMDTQRHKYQMELLIDVILPWLETRDDGYVSGNMFVYFSLAQVKNQDFRGPDFFVTLGVPKGERLSWVVWEEGKSPDVVIELLSESTADADKGIKKQVYQNQLRVPEYFWFDPFNPDDWAGFALREGTYVPLDRDEQNCYFSQQLGLKLVCWRGRFKDIDDVVWLRWAKADGELLPTSQELAEQEHQRAEQEHQRAEQEHQRAEQEHQRAEQEHQRAEEEKQRADRLAEYLRTQGIDPSAV